MPTIVTVSNITWQEAHGSCADEVSVGRISDGIARGVNIGRGTRQTVAGHVLIAPILQSVTVVTTLKCCNFSIFILFILTEAFLFYFLLVTAQRSIVYPLFKVLLVCI